MKIQIDLHYASREEIEELTEYLEEQCWDYMVQSGKDDIVVQQVINSENNLVVRN